MTGNSPPDFDRNDNLCRFVVLFGGRTGSTHLIDILQQQPAVVAKMEHLQHLRGKGADTQLDWVRSLYDQPTPKHVRAIGFKTKLGDVLDKILFADLLDHYGVRVVFMQRRNVVKAAVSIINSHRLFEKTGHWQLFNEADRPDCFEIDIDQLLKMVCNRQGVDEGLAQFVESLDRPKLSVFYEDFLKDEQAELDRIGEFLDVPIVQPAAVQTRIHKVTSDDMSVVLSNFAQVLDALSDPELQAMLCEGSCTEIH